MTWPFLEKMCALGFFSYVDVAFAEQAVSEESHALVLCYLLLAVRSGHVCVSIDQERISPELDLFFPEEYREAIQELLLEGIENLTTDQVVIEGSAYYLKKYWHYESVCLEHLQRLASSSPSVCVDLPSSLDATLTSEQIDAVKTGCAQCFTIISGGPGTGKTFTAAKLIATLKQLLNDDPFEIALAAPTGKAAANLQKSLGDSSIKASTLHELLGIYKKEKSLLTADFVLVDESSMIDIRLMAHLLSSIKPGARLIMLGDPCQLPPVETGDVFFGIVNMFPKHVAKLTKCLRAEREELIAFSHCINQGNSQGALKHLGGCNSVVYRVSDVEQICDHFSQIDTDADLLQAFDQFRVLSPFRKGPYGVEAINRMVFDKLKSAAVPIILTQHAKELGLFNGDVGVLVTGKNYALFKDSLGGARKLELYILPKYEYAYCLSVHKSQGSEYNHVVLLLPDGSDAFGRQVVYTAATRAKKQLGVFFEEKTFLRTVEKRLYRSLGRLGEK